MYTSESKMQTPIANDTVLSGVIEKLQNNLSYQRSVLNEIQGKLHRVLNREENAAKSPNDTQGAVDFYQNFNQQIDVLTGNNSSLDKILKHLSEII